MGSFFVYREICQPKVERSGKINIKANDYEQKFFYLRFGVGDSVGYAWLQANQIRQNKSEKNKVCFWRRRKNPKGNDWLLEWQN